MRRRDLEALAWSLTIGVLLALLLMLPLVIWLARDLPPTTLAAICALYLAVLSLLRYILSRSPPTTGAPSGHDCGPSGGGAGESAAPPHSESAAPQLPEDSGVQENP